MGAMQDIVRIILLCLACFLASKNKYRNSHANNLLIVVLLLLICLVPTGGDYQHYQQVFEQFKLHGDTANLEDGYVPLLIVSGNYTIFRMIIWGAAIMLFLLSLRKSDIKQSVGLYFFAFLFVYIFSYARVSLAMAIAFLGFSIILGSTNKRNKNIIIRWALGAAILYASLFFHKSIGFMLLCVPFAFMNLKKKHFIVLALLFPALVYFANHYMINYLFDVKNVVDDELLSRAITVHSEGSKMLYGLGKILGQLLLYAPLYLLQLFFQRDILQGKIIVNRVEKRVLDYAFFIIYFSSVFAFLDFGTRVIYYRFLYMAYLPTVVACSSILNNRATYERKYQIVLQLALLAQLYSMAYDAYLATY